ncbi:MAG: hypothetical protein F6J98_26585, partial [Moorea sp. SIO4G2]|nr:hypothetical protein [Moorena sp. SIO4G2]
TTRLTCMSRYAIASAKSDSLKETLRERLFFINPKTSQKKLFKTLDN